jgi:hypothetical protein
MEITCLRGKTTSKVRWRKRNYLGGRVSVIFLTSEMSGALVMGHPLQRLVKVPSQLQKKTMLILVPPSNLGCLFSSVQILL